MSELVVRTPAQLVAESKDVAGVCKEIVLRTAVKIQGRQYVRVEGWQSVAIAHGCILSARDVEKTDSGIRAIGEVRRGSDGIVLATAEGFVGDDEPTWAGRPEYARRAMAQCVTLDAEILTRRGFLPYDSIKVGEDVLAYNCEDDVCSWTPLRQVSYFENADVVRLQNRTIDFTATPDHSWAFAGHGLVPYADKPNRGSIIHSARCVDPGASGVSAEDAYLLGWALTDGTIRWAGNSVRIHIDQSKRAQVLKLIEATSRVGAKISTYAAYERTFPTGKTYACLPSYRFQLNASQSRELLTRAGISSKDDPAILELVTNLSADARLAMFTAMIEADGSVKPSGNRGTFGKKKPVVMDAFRILATLEGISLGKMQDDMGMPRQTFRSHRVTYSPSIRETQIGSQPVWCPTTEFGTWVMRQNGVVSITGNTRAMSRAARTAFAHVVTLMDAGLETTPAEEVPDDGFKDVTPPRKPNGNGNGNGHAKPVSTSVVMFILKDTSGYVQTKTEVPKAFWDAYKTDSQAACQSIGGMGNRVAKVGPKWFVFTPEQQTDNNIPDAEEIF